jgi:large subunit ribosomal protein L25
MAAELELGKVYRAAGKHHPLNLDIGDQKLLALIKDVQYNPVKRRMQHVVFQAINRNEKVEAEIPIRLEGEIPAEKAGLMIMNQLDHIEVEALPAKLPDELVIDASKLVELHDKITVADIDVPEGVTILTEGEQPIVTVIEPRAHAAELDAELAEAAEAEAETGEAAAEGEDGQAVGDADTEPSSDSASES